MADQAFFLGLQHILIHFHLLGVVELLGVEGVHMVEVQIVGVHKLEGVLQLAAEITGLLHLGGRQLGG